MARFPEILNVSYWAFNYVFQGSDELGRLLGGEKYRFFTGGKILVT